VTFIGPDADRCLPDVSRLSSSFMRIARQWMAGPVATVAYRAGEKPGRQLCGAEDE
jgi:hypothetical protein